MAGIVADRLKLMADEFEGERRSRGKVSQLQTYMHVALSDKVPFITLD